MNELKKEYYAKFTHKRPTNGDQTNRAMRRDCVEELWQWIEKQLNYARMDQDIINEKYILEKQDEIEKIARVKENEYWLEELFTHEEWDRTLFDNRISQLKGEK